VRAVVIDAAISSAFKLPMLAPAKKHQGIARAGEWCQHYSSSCCRLVATVAFITDDERGAPQSTHRLQGDTGAAAAAAAPVLSFLFCNVVLPNLPVET
jgi:hypothetical protein